MIELHHIWVWIGKDSAGKEIVIIGEFDSPRAPSAIDNDVLSCHIFGAKRCQKYGGG